MFLSSFITQKVVWNHVYLKHNARVDSWYASIVSYFSENKEKTLFKVSSTIVANIMTYANENNVDLEYYAPLCVYLNEKFKNTLIDNSNEDKESISTGYHKINAFCKKSKEEASNETK